MEPLVEVEVSNAREANSRMTVASGSATSKNLKEGIIKIVIVITLKTVFKIG